MIILTCTAGALAGMRDALLSHEVLKQIAFMVEHMRHPFPGHAKREPGTHKHECLG